MLFPTFQACYSERGCFALTNKKDPRLLAEAKPGDDFAIAIDVSTVEVAKLASALAYEHQQTTAGVIIVLMRLQMRCEVLDPFRQNGHLHFG